MREALEMDMTITRRNRLVRRIASIIAERDGLEATHQHCRDVASVNVRGHGQNCCDHAFHDAARNTYAHLADRRVYHSSSGTSHLPIGLPALQQMLGKP